MTKHKTALVLGATGLVGKALVAQLKVDNRYSRVTCIVRQLPYQEESKETDKVIFLEAHFDELDKHAALFAVDHVYVCLGTTIKKAGSQSAFRRVDYDYVYDAALLSAKEQVNSFVWISSVGAKASRHNFYLRVKGELEEAIHRLIELKGAACVQPSLLLGERGESRLAEKIGGVLGKLISPLLVGRLAKYKPITAEKVAEQMIGLQQFS
jgi:uncharacterized protein YbjT (DUF2867 family)